MMKRYEANGEEIKMKRMKGHKKEGCKKEKLVTVKRKQQARQI